MKSYQLQKGVGLVEVLVSLLVIAVGALGILGMQTQALKVAQETYYFNQANVAVNDLYERLRSNQRYAIEHSAYQTDYGKHLQSEENAEVKAVGGAPALALVRAYVHDNDHDHAGKGLGVKVGVGVDTIMG